MTVTEVTVTLPHDKEGKNGEDGIMNDHVRIEDKRGEYAILLIYEGEPYLMDQRRHFNDAKDNALYLARRIKLEVYNQERQISRRKPCKKPSSG